MLFVCIKNISMIIFTFNMNEKKNIYTKNSYV